MFFEKARTLLGNCAATVATTAAILAAGAHSAWADGAHFVPEATEVGWDGVVATVSFREVDVAVKGATTISAKLTAEVKAICTKGESTLDIRASATGLIAKDYPVKNGVVAGVAQFPVEVKITHDPGYTCVLLHRSITAFLEDFRTGATLVHHQG
ncbi:hypothetical protein [Amycolatopsis dendrobii]|uniref:Uncharacterized protein n=1 Tax=Amycolatopsis dendrobii TaxID=2760662 RepID=A0A7W3ZEV7_9PSEU|nr:hypothetical protein [Amycolatopsis dendrobii]MBB1158443.1 hypothetical protein [Amycolatopsis dendrobii]